MNSQRLRIQRTRTLLEGWSKVIRVEYLMQRRDGTWQKQDRDMLDRGDGITVLLVNKAKKTLLLLKQPRLIATVRGANSSETIEACNGLLEPGENPRNAAIREVEEETGYVISDLTPVAQVYASPGASMEIVHIYLAELNESARHTMGGGLPAEGEDIELMEVPIETAMTWMDDGSICDARSIIAIQYAQLKGIFG